MFWFCPTSSQSTRCMHLYDSRRVAFVNTVSDAPLLNTCNVSIFSLLSHLPHHCTVLNSLICANLPLRMYSLTHSKLWNRTPWTAEEMFEMPFTWSFHHVQLFHFPDIKQNVSGTRLWFSLSKSAWINSSCRNGWWFYALKRWPKPSYTARTL